ncbi:uncharacterized protein At1g76660-like isoform X2 [Phragmites australis]|uniref:uncharacterized protein At1g76660-like isoform X2 n=2 Tax=Phragmites australis TaxID=29695 RepID=UPI002D7A2BD1|nr:uncharacterized protein At1g76660-like isoform X2 [Phragmites australis]XP_062193449.1 uncharacterized protein At1g76660-like isoform X2 [Phragmites australis]XP_062193450.1 uncharacterized protein At1g76660-like isoform X2 [Phragmites australis]
MYIASRYLLRHAIYQHHTLRVMQIKKRWWSRLKAKLQCFRPHGHPQRIADAVSTSPEPTEQAAASSSSYYTRHAPQSSLAFVAPPPSPASSVLTSESPSPVVLLNTSSYSSPTASIFAIGPYAREPQQLVSPPAFSAGFTEPSTAPITPPPECLHLATTPSSPEVPFARFLSPSTAEPEQHCGGTEGFHAYQLHPGSPIGGHLVSPGSTSSSPPVWMFEAEEMASRKLHRRNEGSLLDGGRIPEAEGGAEASTGIGSARNNETCDEVAKSGEFVFGCVDGWSTGSAGGGSTDMRGGGGGDTTEGRKQQWPFFLPHT